MTLLDLMDAIQVHAAAAAAAAYVTGSKAYDVAVGFPASKGRCVRIYYGGERETERFPDDETLNSQLVAQAINVVGYWPTPSAAPKEHRLIEGEMAAFVKDLRTRINGDYTLGGKAADGLRMGLTTTDQIVLAQTQYAVCQTEIVVDYDEHSYAP